MELCLQDNSHAAAPGSFCFHSMIAMSVVYVFGVGRAHELSLKHLAGFLYWHLHSNPSPSLCFPGVDPESSSS